MKRCGHGVSTHQLVKTSCILRRPHLAGGLELFLGSMEDFRLFPPLRGGAFGGLAWCNVPPATNFSCPWTSWVLVAISRIFMCCHRPESPTMHPEYNGEGPRQHPQSSRTPSFTSTTTVSSRMAQIISSPSNVYWVWLWSRPSSLFLIFSPMARIFFSFFFPRAPVSPPCPQRQTVVKEVRPALRFHLSLRKGAITACPLINRQGALNNG